MRLGELTKVLNTSLEEEEEKVEACVPPPSSFLLLRHFFRSKHRGTGPYSDGSIA